MGKMRFSRNFVMFILILTMLWPLYSLYDVLHARGEKQDATFLLYQVSLFQMELLNSMLGENGHYKNTEQLNELKQAAYSANYTHERLMLAVGPESLTELRSISQLMQYILRLQIGGNRPLKQEELQALQEAGKQFKTLVEDYGKLMPDGGYRIQSSERDKVEKADRAIAEMFRKKLLQ